jgi:hypothetical protein
VNLSGHKSLLGCSKYSSRLDQLTSGANKYFQAKIKALSQSKEQFTTVSPVKHEDFTTVSPAKHEDFRLLFCDKYDTTNFRLHIAENSVNGAFNIVCNSIPDNSSAIELWIKSARLC